MTKLSEISHLLIDMDGVLYRGNNPMPRLQEFMGFLRQRPISFMMVTNNSTRTPQQYAAKLARMGVEITPAEVLNSGQATARFLARDYPPGTRVHVFGQDSLRQAVAEEGFVVADEDGGCGGGQHGPGGDLRETRTRHPAHSRWSALCGHQPGPDQPGRAWAASGHRFPDRRPGNSVRNHGPWLWASPSQPCSSWPWRRWAPGRRRRPCSATAWTPTWWAVARAGCKTIGVLSGSSGRAEMEAFGPDFLFEDIAGLLDALAVGT